MTHVQISRAQAMENAPPALARVNKWQVFRALVKAQQVYGINERDLSLLQGLLTFYPQDELAPGAALIIFPSNRKICERMNGMADSTMRRHLRHLIEAGLLLRRDSNNGKRFAIGQDADRAAFGLDLSPLLHHARAITEAATRADAEQQQAKRLKQDIAIMRRDLFAMVELLEPQAALTAQNYWHDGTKILRRKLSLDALTRLHGEHLALLAQLKSTLLNSSDSQNEQHIQNSEINIYESEVAKTPEIEPKPQTQNMPLAMVVKACPILQSLTKTPITQWCHLIAAAHDIVPAMGISKDCYDEAVKWLGRAQASIVVAAILQRFDTIRSPGAYLRHLIKQAAAQKFTCGPMIMALLGKAVPT